jgi:hypothetical protein
MGNKKELEFTITLKEKYDMVDGKTEKDLSGFLNKNTKILITNITDSFKNYYDN